MKFKFEEEAITIASRILKGEVSMSSKKNDE
jgi:hypothetical protein